MKQALDEDRVDGHLSNALVGRIMRAPDWGFQRLMMDRGFGFEEARRYTLTGQLRSKPGQTALSLLRPQHELGAKVNPGGVGTQAELPWAETAGGATRGDQARSAVGQGLQLGVNLGRRALTYHVQMQALEMGVSVSWVLCCVDLKAWGVAQPKRSRHGGACFPRALR